MSDDHEDLRLRLEAISEELGDAIMTVLREALDSGATGRPPAERLLGRARNAVDKAAGLLTQLDRESGS